MQYYVPPVSINPLPPTLRYCLTFHTCVSQIPIATLTLTVELNMYIYICTLYISLSTHGHRQLGIGIYTICLTDSHRHTDTDSGTLHVYILMYLPCISVDALTLTMKLDNVFINMYLLHVSVYALPPTVNQLRVSDSAPTEITYMQYKRLMIQQCQWQCNDRKICYIYISIYIYLYIYILGDSSQLI